MPLRGSPRRHRGVAARDIATRAACNPDFFSALYLGRYNVAVSYDQNLATRVRGLLAKRTDVVEKKMIGGICFMVGGAMCCGLTKSDFVVRVGPDEYEDALAQPHARPMAFTGRPLAGMVYVAPEGLKNRPGLAKWIERGLRFVSSLPSKPATKRKSTSDARRTPKSKGASLAARAPARDPRADRVLREFLSDPELAPIVAAFQKTNPGASKFGSNGLKVDGKLFALFTQGTLVVKLPKERVAALVGARVGRPFDPGHGRVMKQWLTVMSAKASWVDLAREAFAFATRGR
jgi:TfoX/Sxy family transcriptional regulator of competence genes